MLRPPATDRRSPVRVRGSRHSNNASSTVTKCRRWGALKQASKAAAN